MRQLHVTFVPEMYIYVEMKPADMNTFVDKTQATNSLQTMKWTVQALQAVTADNNVLRLQWVCCEGPVRLHPACT